MSSKFDKIFEAKSTQTKSAKVQRKRPASDIIPLASNPTDTVDATRRGRPNGKRSNPDYIGFTTYIRRETHTAVKIALLQEGEGRELSEIVEELLNTWLESRK